MTLPLVNVKITQPNFLLSAFGDPLPVPSADVVQVSPLGGLPSCLRGLFVPQMKMYVERGRVEHQIPVTSAACCATHMAVARRALPTVLPQGVSSFSRMMTNVFKAALPIPSIYPCLTTVPLPLRNPSFDVEKVSSCSRHNFLSGLKVLGFLQYSNTPRVVPPVR